MKRTQVTSDKQELVASLSSDRPSVRMSAALNMHRNPSLADREAIEAAIRREPVSRIRDALEAILALIEGSAAPVKTGSASGQGQGAHTPDLEPVPDDFSGIIEHELSSAIGWIDYTAHHELSACNGYEGSETATAVRVLQKRVEGLVALATVQRLPVLTTESLQEVLLESVPPHFPGSLLHFDVDLDAGGHDQVDTDRGLMCLILVNALKNAAEATLMTEPDSSGISMSYSTTDENFSITISNSHSGAPFSLNDVAATGYSTKPGSRGLGVHVMRLAAARLGYDLRLQGTGGVVTLTLKGLRRDAN